MVTINSKFYVENVSDFDAPYYVAFEHRTERVLSRGYDLTRVVRDATTATAGIAPTSPNYENTEIAFLAGN